MGPKNFILKIIYFCPEEPEVVDSVAEFRL